MRAGKFFIFILLICWQVSTAQHKRQAPNFSLNTLDGKVFVLKEHIGQGPLVINFWASWCVPCRSELKKMKKLYQKYHPKGVAFVAIAIDDPKTVANVHSLVHSKRYPFIVLLDTENQVKRLYEVQNIPHTFVLNKKGEIVYDHAGYRKGDEKRLDSFLEKLLSSTAK